MPTEIFWVAVGGIVIVILVPFSIISSKMLDGFGKSMYSLLFTGVKIVLDICLIYVLNLVFNNASSVLISLVLSEVAMSITYYLFLRYLFRNFDKKYDGKSTVKTFKKEDKNTYEIKSDNWSDKSVLKKGLLLFALILSIICIFLILCVGIRFHHNSILIVGIVSLICIFMGYYLGSRVDRMKLHLIQLIILAVIFFLFLNYASYITTIYFIVISVLLLYIISILHKLKSVKV